MRILWITNILFPEVCNELNITPPVVGGWMHSSASYLIENNKNIQLAVASLHNVKEIKSINKNNILYFLIPESFFHTDYNYKLEKYFIQINDNFKPDIIHIHGTEYPHSLICLKALGNKKTVVSIQGLVSIYSKYYFGGIPDNEIRNTKTLRDIIRNDSLSNQQKRMKKRGSYELELIKNINNVIGRTTWDSSNIWTINPLANFFFCNETLRNSFYQKKWGIKNCKKYTIFLSQGHYPIKGLQQIIKALPLILEHFPKTKVYVAGNDFMNISWYKKNGFAIYLKKLMSKYKISDDKIVFLGVLDEELMVKQYAEAHVFVCPSIIENSPNSVGEAQLVGTPCVASYVGGTMDMVIDGETGFLYRFEEISLLAKRVCQIFSNDNLATYLSENAHISALKRHDKFKNATQLYSIYKKILNDSIPNL